MMMLLWFIILSIALFTIVVVWTKIYNLLRVKIVICLSGVLWMVYMLVGWSMNNQKDTFIENYNAISVEMSNCRTINWAMANNFDCYAQYAHDTDNEILRYEKQ